MTVLIGALTSLGLLEYDNARLHCTPTAAAYLVRGAPGDARQIYLTWLRNRDHLVQTVRTGMSPGDHEIDEAQDDWTAYAAPELVRWPAEVSGIAGRIADRGVVVESGDRILDLGCGSGIISMALAATQPDIQVVCVDRPGVLLVARQLADDMGLSDRVEFIEGDVDRVAVPTASFDLVVLANVAQYLDDDRLDATLATARSSLVDGGSLYMVTPVLDLDDENAPWLTIVEMLLATSIDQRSTAQLLDHLQRAGFADVQRPVPSVFIAR